MVIRRHCNIVCLAGTCIRLGICSEIIGLPTNNNNGVVFARDYDILKYRFEKADKISFSKRKEELENIPNGKVPLLANIKYKDRFVVDESFVFYEKELKDIFWDILILVNIFTLLPLSYSIFKNKNIYYEFNILLA